MKRLTAAIFFFITFLGLSCHRMPTEFDVYIQEGIFPLIPGSLWEYEVGMPVGDAYQSYTETVRVGGTTTINGKKAYEVIHTVSGKEKKAYYYVHQDSVFELHYNFRQPIWALRYIMPQQTPVTFNSFLFGDASVRITVTRIDSLIQTPAGDFRQSYQFVQDRGSYYIEEYLVPKVGLVKLYSYWKSSNELIQLKVLTSYEIGR